MSRASVRLRALNHCQLVNRFYIPRSSYHSQNNYYLDNPASLDLFKLFGRATPHLDHLELRRNREKNYAAVNDLTQVEELQGRLLFPKHELMISRFHGMLELACRESGGQVELAEWHQGSTLWYTVTARKMYYNLDSREWHETDQTERLPVRPDAFFTLRFKSGLAGDQDLHLFYEADCKTTSGSSFARKLRAYHEFIFWQKTERHHERHFGVRKIRAVLTETIDPRWGEHLRFTAASGFIAPKPSVLFWFTTSTLFTKSLGSPKAPKRGNSCAASPIPSSLTAFGPRRLTTRFIHSLTDNVLRFSSVLRLLRRTLALGTRVRVLQQARDDLPRGNVPELLQRGAQYGVG